MTLPVTESTVRYTYDPAALSSSITRRRSACASACVVGPWLASPVGAGATAFVAATGGTLEMGAVVLISPKRRRRAPAPPQTDAGGEAQMDPAAARAGAAQARACLPPWLAEQTQERRRRGVRDRQGLNAKLLLGLQGLQGRAFLREVGVDQ